jgi:hypothetical protein
MRILEHWLQRPRRTERAGNGRGGAPMSDVSDRDGPDRGGPDREATHPAHEPAESDGSGRAAGSNGQTALSIREAAAQTGRTEAAIYHLIATGQLPAQPTASRGLSILPTDLEPWERRSRRSGRFVRSLWESIQQRAEATVRRLRTGMRSLLAGMPPDVPGPPWYWIMPYCAWLAPRW